MAGMQEFGALIKRAREENGWSGVDLAVKLGRPHSFVVRWETGKFSNPPDPQTFADFSRVLGLSREEMLTALGYLEPVRETHERPFPKLWEEAMRALEDVKDQPQILKILPGQLRVLAEVAATRPEER